MENKEKKGFWASLFSSKSNKCSCSAGYTIPTEKESTVAPIVDASKVKEIKVLGPGCAKCKSTYAVVEKVVKNSGLDITVTKVDDIGEIMRYNIMSTPAIVINETVVMKGKVPSVFMNGTIAIKCNFQSAEVKKKVLSSVVMPIAVIISSILKTAIFKNIQIM